MKLFIASDHAGVELKTRLIEAGKSRGIEWVDLGPATTDSVDYPDYAHDLCKRILAEKKGDELSQPCGVLICGSGVGMSIAANRHKGIRAVLALRKDVAVLSRQHNAANVLCLGARLMNESTAFEILNAWVGTSFEGGRHQNRVDKI